MKPIIPPLIDLPKALCNHLIGENHSLAHRLICGACLMVVGVAVAHTASALPEGAGFIADLTGYLIHGIGSTPVIEAIMLARKL